MTRSSPAANRKSRPTNANELQLSAAVVHGPQDLPRSGWVAEKRGSKPSVEEVQKHAATAKRYFAAMDKNKDGTIGEDEWAQSRRLKPFFEKAGIKIRSMSESDFAGKYAQAMKSVGK